MRRENHTKVIVSMIVVICVLFGLNGCETSLRAKFAPLRSLPPGQITKQAKDIVIMEGLPPVSAGQYIELGYIKVDEDEVSILFSDIVARFTSDADIMNMIRAKAAEVGADAVINFKKSLSGEFSARKGEGTAIKYEKTNQ